MIHSSLGLALIVNGILLYPSHNFLLQSDFDAKWIWAKQDSYTNYYDTIIARKSFDLTDMASAQIAITADARDRMIMFSASGLVYK